IKAVFEEQTHKSAIFVPDCFAIIAESITVSHSVGNIIPIFSTEIQYYDPPYINYSSLRAPPSC
ncbi:MAG: hypothetical protein K2H39_02830, partial [Paramuribaculum sp.]|nr:hypothetical protein [Paramuribaculum sp.]